MKTIEIERIKTADVSFELINAIEQAKKITNDFSVVSDGRRCYEVTLEIHKGTNLYNSSIILTNNHGEQVGYYAGGLFWASFGYRGQQINFIR